MSVFAMLASQAMDNGGMRVTLLILLFVAIALIITGSIIAVFTLFQQRKERTLYSDEAFKE